MLRPRKLRANPFVGIAVLLLLFVGVFYLICKEGKVTPSQEGEATMQAHVFNEARLSFSYPKHLFLLEKKNIQAQDLEGSILLTENTQANKDVLLGKATASQEGPTTISFFIYKNDKHLLPRMWLEAQETWKLSNQKIEEGVYGGAQAYTYSWDGLYKGRTTVIGHGNYVYAISVTYTGNADPLLQDSQKVLDSLSFLP